jgi:hypothetical protein
MCNYFAVVIPINMAMTATHFPGFDVGTTSPYPHLQQHSSKNENSPLTAVTVVYRYNTIERIVIRTSSYIFEAVTTYFKTLDETALVEYSM